MVCILFDDNVGAASVAPKTNMAKLNNFSASGIAAQSNRPRPRIYDEEHDYIHILDRRETKAYAVEILHILETSGDWVSGPQLRRMTGSERVRLWDAALGLLVDLIETRGVLIPHYRRADLKRMRTFSRQEANTYSHRRRQSDPSFPTAAFEVKR